MFRTDTQYEAARVMLSTLAGTRRVCPGQHLENGFEEMPPPLLSHQTQFPPLRWWEWGGGPPAGAGGADDCSARRPGQN